MLKIDQIVGGVVIALGGFLFAFSRTIEGFGDDPVGPRFLPQTTTLGLVMLGGLLVARAGTGLASGDRPTATTSERPRWLPVVLLALIALIYTGLFHAFGYLAATLLVLPAVLVVFGHRSALKIVALSCLVSTAFYGVFFGLLGVYDSPGVWLDLSGLLR